MPRKRTTDQERRRGADLGRRLARRRGALSQEHVARTAGISVEALRKVEQGHVAGPSVFLVVDVAAAIDATLDDLVRPRSRARVTKPATR
ncbi:MAG: helix-turn-helix transcriptional regulator [Frankiaceae bacterium]|nr:helix-turn-helix transcriptional regulator [Frankiaceae bacterium]MBV9869593.1 helix-turn-helix transcriptional regulator [Frankiaceae bacterium]